MKGVVLAFNEDTSSGVISAEDGRRYHFAGMNWRSERYPGSGMHVDFEPGDGTADNIYIDPCHAKNAEKNRMAAAMLAFFFGWFGFHKFYLGNIRPATTMLSISLGSLVLLAVLTLRHAQQDSGVSLGVLMLLAVPTLIMMVIGFVEFLIYVTASDEAFEQTYIVGRKDWF